MKKLVVISDSHGKKKAVEKVAPLFEENDYVIHLGDGASDLKETFSHFPEKTYICKGNCDLFYGNDEFVLEIEKVRILCCHGHRYGVKSNLYRLAEHAKSLDCEVALYGHTHVASVEKVDGVTCINPGSLGSFVEPSYCYLVVHGNEVTPTVVDVSRK